MLARPVTQSLPTADDTAEAHPPPIALGRELPWVLFALSLLALLYMVGIDEGAASLVRGTALHEWVHDGRHLLGFPCH
jgi:hypothetical protein